MPVSSTSHSSTRMRPLPRWSANSFMKTVPQPVQTEPLRRALLLPLEIVAIDRIEAGLDMVETHQRAARSDDRGTELGADIARRDEIVFAVAGLCDTQHAVDAAKDLGEVGADSFDLDAIAAAQ